MSLAEDVINFAIEWIEFVHALIEYFINLVIYFLFAGDFGWVIPIIIALRPLADTNSHIRKLLFEFFRLDKLKPVFLQMEDLYFVPNIKNLRHGFLDVHYISAKIFYFLWNHQDSYLRLFPDCFNLFVVELLQ